MTKLFFPISTLTAVSSACVICMLVHLKGETISNSILGDDGTYLEIYYLDTFNLNRDIKNTKPRIHQFTNVKCCKMSFKAFDMKWQGLKCLLK